eukprot:gene11336-2064_t
MDEKHRGSIGVTQAIAYTVAVQILVKVKIMVPTQSCKGSAWPVSLATHPWISTGKKPVEFVECTVKVTLCSIMLRRRDSSAEQSPSRGMDRDRSRDFYAAEHPFRTQRPGQHLSSSFFSEPDPDDDPVVSRRGARFQNLVPQSSVPTASIAAQAKLWKKSLKGRSFALAEGGADAGWQDMPPLQGLGTALEKDYARLTPGDQLEPNKIRSQPVLEESLKHILKKAEVKDEPYNFLKTNLLSIRQDLQVQHLVNKFTTHVYETHARLALRYKDITEFHKCQQQLTKQYQLGLILEERSVTEFVAYRLIYAALQGDSMSIIGLLKSFKPEHLADASVQHAIEVIDARVCDNWIGLARLYSNAPNQGRAVFDLFYPLMRQNVFWKQFVFGYSPGTAPFEYAIRWLFPDSLEPDSEGKDPVAEFFKSVRARHHLSDPDLVDCKQSYQSYLEMKREAAATPLGASAPEDSM